MTASDSYYEINADQYAQSTVNADLEPVRAKFLALATPGAKLLDVGCGSGRDLLAFRKGGYRPLGIDTSRALVSRATEYSGCPCLVQDVRGITWEREFDGIWACASLMHLPKRDLADVLFRLRRAMTRNSIMYISVPAGTLEGNQKDGRFMAAYARDELVGYLIESRFFLIEIWTSPDALGRGTSWINLLSKPVDDDPVP